MRQNACPMTPTHQATNRIPYAKAGLALFVATFGWALAPVFIRLLKDAYDPYSQAFVRYISATVVLVLISLLRYRAEFMRLLRDPKVMIALGLLNAGQQYTWTAGTYGSTATIAQLISKLSIVFVIVMSFILFREERGVIRSPYYILGTLLSFVGVAAILTHDPASLIPVLDHPAIMLLLTAFLWGVYTVWSKHAVTHIHPIPMFTVLSLYTTLTLGAMMVFLGNPETLITAGAWTTAVAFFSGMLPIAAAHPCFNYSQKYLGAALSSSINLINPLFTFLIALPLWADENLLPSQWAGSAVLVAGTLLVTLAGRRKNEAPKLP